MMRLRRGKLCAMAGVRSGNSEITTPALATSRRQRAVAGRIDDVDAGADDRDRGGIAVGRQSAAVRGRVDAEREPADDRDAACASARGKAPRRWRCPAGSRCGCRRSPATGRFSSSSRPTAKSTGGGSAVVEQRLRIVGVGERQQRVIGRGRQPVLGGVDRDAPRNSAVAPARGRAARAATAAAREPGGKDRVEAGRMRQAAGARCAGRGPV